MATRMAWCLIFLVLGLFCAGSSVTEKPLNQATENTHWHLEQHQRPILPSSARKLIEDESNEYFSSTEPDVKATVPVINPTIPGGTGAMPSPLYLSPFLQTPTQPTTTPLPPSAPTFTTPSAPTFTTPTPTTGSSSGKSWCIASGSAPETAIQVALDYACGYGGADCSPIQQGGTCYNPNTLKDHASFAFNSYYQKNPVPTSCNFGSTATITTTDPSSGSCQFPSSSTSSPTPPTAMPPPGPTTPTTIPPPIDFGSPPNGSTDIGQSPPMDGSSSVPPLDGDEPSGSSSASSLIHSLLFFRCLCLVPTLFIATFLAGL